MRGAMTRVSCSLTFEFTRLRKRAKPAVAGRVQRRVSPRLAGTGPIDSHGKTTPVSRWSPHTKRGLDLAKTVNKRKRGAGCVHRASAQALAADSPGTLERERRATAVASRVLADTRAVRQGRRRHAPCTRYRGGPNRRTTVHKTKAASLRGLRVHGDACEG